LRHALVFWNRREPHPAIPDKYRKQLSRQE
jgi:hypothetical protein